MAERINFYLDEHVPTAVASGLRRRGVDVLTVQEAGMLEAEDEAHLAHFLAEGAQGREEQIRLVAQTIINILPDDDPERRLLEGFLQGRDTLPDAPRQRRLW